MATDQLYVACCTAVVMAFILKVRSVSLAHLRKSVIVVNGYGLTVSFFSRKGQPIRRPLILQNARSAEWGKRNPIELMEHWLLIVRASIIPVPLSKAMQRVLILTDSEEPLAMDFTLIALTLGAILSSCC